MPRRKRIFTKPDRRDPRYDSPVVGHLITKVMQDGKRSLAQRIVYAAIDRANEGTDTVDPLEVITRAVENSKPRVEVKSRRVGGATYQVPVEVPSRRARTLAVRWLVDFARNRNEYSMSEVNGDGKVDDGFKGPDSIFAAEIRAARSFVYAASPYSRRRPPKRRSRSASPPACTSVS